MQVDFYQLLGTPAEQVIARIGERILSTGGRLIVIAEDEAYLSKLDRMLWDQGPTSFLPHALAGGAEDARQPILLTTTPDAPNLARNALIADGVWRESALSYDRSFFLFDNATLKPAREAWKSLADRDGVERNYRAREDGSWAKMA
ncbi:MAG: DNA polymerase III subunit chi [Sphingomonas sp.]|nr:DNA polymerase III subunit chi [Sphingomonas sp.]